MKLVTDVGLGVVRSTVSCTGWCWDQTVALPFRIRMLVSSEIEGSAGLTGWRLTKPSINLKTDGPTLGLLIGLISAQLFVSSLLSLFSCTYWMSLWCSLAQKWVFYALSSSCECVYICPLCWFASVPGTLFVPCMLPYAAVAPFSGKYLARVGRSGCWFLSKV